MMATEGIDDAEFQDVVMGENPSDTATAAAAKAEAAAEGEPPAAKEAPAPGSDGQDDKDGENKPGEGDGDAEGGNTPPLQDDKEKPKGGIQTRIDGLTARLRDAERRAARAEATISAPNSSDKDAPTGKPSRDQFPNDEDGYIEAISRWAAKDERTKGATQEFTSALEDADGIRAERWGAKVEAVKTTLPDWQDVVSKSETPVKGYIMTALMEADKGPELAHHLALNPDIAEKLNEMSPARAMIEIGRIESSLESKEAPPPPPKEGSKAPPPITPVTSGSTTTKPVEKIDDMDEYVARRRKQGALY